MYKAHFRSWLAITAPASILAIAVDVIVSNRVREMFSSIPFSDLFHHWPELAAATSMRFGSYFLVWLLGCFAFGAIASLVDKVSDGPGEEEDTVSHPGLSDNYEGARERVGPLLLLAVFTFILFLGGCGINILVDSAVSRVIGRNSNSVILWSSIVGYVVMASVLAWFGPAIPLAVCRHRTAWQALRESIRVSNGFEGFLFILVVESVAGSYVAGLAVQHEMMPLLYRVAGVNDWSPWIQLGLIVLASAAIQPPLFIGLSLLARRDSAAVPLFAAQGAAN
jgi:hypothetical protein